MSSSRVAVASFFFATTRTRIGGTAAAAVSAGSTRRTRRALAVVGRTNTCRFGSAVAYNRRPFSSSSSSSSSSSFSSATRCSSYYDDRADAVTVTTTTSPSSSSKSFSLDVPECNVSRNVAAKIGANLHLRPSHPLSILTRRIVEYFDGEDGDSKTKFQLFDDLSPVVSTEQNFDSLRIPSDHVSRLKSDTYYLDAGTVLRTHTSCHQVDLLSRGADRFLLAGDVYRRDEIDKSHYPVFHQMEGVKVFGQRELEAGSSSSPSKLSEEQRQQRQQQRDIIERDLKRTLEGLAQHLFGSVEMRWVDEYFPFTDPSYELEVRFQGEWMEVLGCGVVHPDILRNAGRAGEQGWAFGLGLERLAMVLFDIPDIRLFWTADERFHSQFTSGRIVKFVPYSKYPPCYKDISFWLPDGQRKEGSDDDTAWATDFHVNDLNELIRDVGGDLIEEVTLIDDFRHPKTGRVSHCYRIAYRSMDRSLTNAEIDALQLEVRERVVQEIGAELR